MEKLKQIKIWIGYILLSTQFIICMPSNSCECNNNSASEYCNKISYNYNKEAEQQIDELSFKNDLTGLKIAITAGPTHEVIDAVSYISTNGSGKMGYAIAKAAISRGAEVTLISGPTNLAVPDGVKCISVTSAEDMYNAAMTIAAEHDIFIGTAAVADYRPAQSKQNKTKKKENEYTIKLELVHCIDVIANVARLAINRPFVVGFAAETKDLARYAQDKLAAKNLDLICANDIAKPNHGFNSETNALHLYWKNGDKALELTSKLRLSHQLLSEIFTLYQNQEKK